MSTLSLSTLQINYQPTNAMTTQFGTTELKRYRYRYETPCGQAVTGTIEAEDLVDAGAKLDFLMLNEPRFKRPHDWGQAVMNAKLKELPQSTEDDAALLKDFNGPMLILFLIGACMVLFAIAKYIFDVFGKAGGM
jgi:hypothetical protein